MQSILIGRGSGGRIVTLSSGDGAAAAGRLLDPIAIVGPAFDDAIDEIVRPEMRHVLDRGHDVHDDVILEHTKPEIIEKQDLHGILPCDFFVGATR